MMVKPDAHAHTTQLRVSIAVEHPSEMVTLVALEIYIKS